MLAHTIIQVILQDDFIVPSEEKKNKFHSILDPAPSKFIPMATTCSIITKIALTPSFQIVVIKEILLLNVYHPHAPGLLGYVF